MSERLPKVNSHIMHHVGALIAKEVTLKPGVLVSITEVTTSKDINYTDIMISVIPISEREYALRTLHHEAKHIRHELGKHVRFRTLPRLRFHIDTREDKAAHLNAILRTVHHEDEARENSDTSN